MTWEMIKEFFRGNFRVTLNTFIQVQLLPRKLKHAHSTYFLSPPSCSIIDPWTKSKWS